MKRRDFLKGAAVASAIVGAGVKPGHAKAGLALGNTNVRRIDSYCHWSNLEILSILQAAGQKVVPGFQHPFDELFANDAPLIDIDARLAMMEQVGVDRSILAPLPWIETIPTPAITRDVSLAAAQSINNQMIKMVKEYPDKFSAMALLPLLNKVDMIAEFRRCVDAGLIGGFYVCAYNCKPPDSPDFFDWNSDDTLYGVANELGVPLWLHPAKPPTLGDYAGEDAGPPDFGPGSKYNIFQTLSWLLDTSVAEVRIVFAGVFEKYPDLKIILHHHGALIPPFTGRLVNGWEFFEQDAGKVIDTPISKPYIDHFKKFYCDTATQGYAPELIQAAVDFYGVERVLFGSDAPMDASGGIIFTDKALESVMDTRLSHRKKAQILHRNIENLINI